MADIFQNKLNYYLGDGARPSKFSITIDPPEGLTLDISTGDSTDGGLTGGAAGAALHYFCSATKFPGVTQESIDFKYLGRNIPIPGVTIPNQEWSATFYNDEKHGIRKFFLDWINLYQHWNYADKEEPNKNFTKLPTISLHQYDYELKSPTALYTLVGVFPISMGDIEAQYSELNQIETFEVTFKYSYFKITELEAGLSADSVKQEIKSTVNSIVNSLLGVVTNTLKAGVNKAAKSVNSELETLASSMYVGG